jgi:hypothetical protein
MKMTDVAINTIEGEQVVTVGRYGAKTTGYYPIWSMKTYCATKNSRGQLQWILQDCVGRSRSGKFPSDKFLREAREFAESKGLRFLDDVVQYQLCK